ncbi:hypothetical protein KCU72_g14, partial [Aureobasidium melanogenum]
LLHQKARTDSPVLQIYLRSLATGANPSKCTEIEYQSDLLPLTVSLAPDSTCGHRHSTILTRHLFGTTITSTWKAFTESSGA